MKKYYVYKITFLDGTFYIGYRGTSGTPESDFLVKYFSSSKVVNNKIKDTQFSGEILYKDLLQEDAYTLEQQIIKQQFDEANCLNKACYFGRKGFGVFSELTKEKLSSQSKSRWNNPKYREHMREVHKKRWESNPLLSENQSKRLTGKKRPEHAEKMKGRKLLSSHPFFNKTKSEEHKENISIALKNHIKTDEHRRNLALSRQHNRGLLIDHQGICYELYTDFLTKYNLDRSFLSHLNNRIATKTLIKLGIDPIKYKGATPSELGIRFQKISI